MTFTVALVNNNVNAVRNIRAYIPAMYQNVATFVVDGTGDFDCATTIAGSREEAWITGGNDVPGTTQCEGEKFFNLEPGETVVVTLKARYKSVDPIPINNDFIVLFYTGTSFPPSNIVTANIFPYKVVPGGVYDGLGSTSFQTNSPLIFTGNITMNNQTVFDFNEKKNHKLLFAPGTGMELAAGSIVKMPHILVEGCDNMWKGITVRQGATLELSTMTTIKDAQYAVNVQKGGTLKATDCLFINNNYGVRTAPEGSGAYNLLVLGNHFATEGSGLKAAFAGQSPAPYEGRGYMGIALADAGSFSISKSINGSENMF